MVCFGFFVVGGGVVFFKLKPFDRTGAGREHVSAAIPADLQQWPSDGSNKQLRLSRDPLTQYLCLKCAFFG